MPISASWFNDEKTIILQRFEGTWTLEDYYRFIDQMVDYLNSVPHYVHIIAVGSQIKGTPREMFSGFRYAVKKIPDNEGIIVLIDTPMLLKSFLSLLPKLPGAPQREVYLADDIPQAAELIRAHEHKYAHLQPQ